MKLIETLKHLRDIGNTLIVVEHDEETIIEADHVVDIGPGAGEHGCDALRNYGDSDCRFEQIKTSRGNGTDIERGSAAFPAWKGQAERDEKTQ